MARKNSIVQKKDIRVGKTVWVVRYGCEVVKFFIKDSYVSRNGVFLKGHTGNSALMTFSCGDKGVIDSYDQRPAQIFTNKRAAEFFANYWNGVEPNFLVRLENNQCRGDVVSQFKRNYEDYQHECDMMFPSGDDFYE